MDTFKVLLLVLVASSDLYSFDALMFLGVLPYGCLLCCFRIHILLVLTFAVVSCLCLFHTNVSCMLAPAPHFL